MIYRASTFTGHVAPIPDCLGSSMCIVTHCSESGNDGADSKKARAF